LVTDVLRGTIEVAYQRTPILGGSEFENFAELKAAFGTVDKVGELYVFDIGGNKYRLIADVRLSRRLVFIKAVLPHSEYDKGKWK
jgi:mRNA interferase HigB